ncbi:MAG: PBP1A family penicillin-binding protein [Alphaproteobacteria bacterium]|nr:PBP1A family penicillin-binding protein [Alphaproteobacteria bacterium]
MRRTGLKKQKLRAEAKPAKAPKKTLRKPKKKVTKEAKRRSLWITLFMAALWVLLVLMIVAGVYIWHCQATLPAFSKAVYVEREPGVKILASDGQELTSYGALFAKPVDVKKLPSYVSRAVIDTEDRRFYKHSGFDYIGFVRAMAVNVVKRRYAQGASTITQQVAKNLFLTQEKSIKRKVQEFLLARWLEKNFSKNQILNIYLNRVFFGSGAYGINAAAKRFFNKNAKDLNLREAAILAGALKAPSRYNYLRNKEQALKRAGVVLSLMERAGTISAKEREAALKQPVGNSKEKMILGIRYFGDYVMAGLPEYLKERSDDVYVKTTLDYHLQQRAEYLLRKHLRENKKNNVSEGAVVILDNKNGAIRAMVGGFDYNKSQFNRATQALRQAGSSFKLFVYLTAFEKGFSPDELLADEPIQIDDWKPENYDKRFHGAVSLKEAFAKSLNVATVDLATYLSLDEIISTALKLGITTTVKNEPSIVLGAAEVRVLDMAAAYGATANDGYAVFAYAIESITDTDGNVLYQHKPAEKVRVLSEQSVKNINLLMREVVLKGTGKKAAKVLGARGKTGTSQNYRDAWFIGTNSKYTAAVWVGNDDNSPMNEIGGGSVPTEIWADIMK